jgi:DNA-binding NarL/FixJ family response regulator
VAVLTASDAADDISTAIDHGIYAYILKGATGGELLQAVHDAHLGKLYVSPRAMDKLVVAHQAQQKPAGPDALTKLSRQEVRVLQLVAQGNSNRQVGELLDIQEKTVKFHLSSIYIKLGVRNRVEATLAAQRFWKTPRT